MKNIKIVFFDIDQTLHRLETGFMPDSAKEAIRALRKNGIHTAIASGRTMAGFPPYINELIKEGAFDFVVSINGQLNCEIINGEKKIITHRPMPKNYMTAVVDYCQKENIAYSFVGGNSVISSVGSDWVKEALTGIYEVKVANKPEETDEVYQMLIYVDEPMEEKFKTDQMVWEGFEMLRWHPYSVDLVQQNGAKSRGIRDVCEYLNISLENTMAFGDGHNDYDMISMVGLGVAMGDAIERIKNIADYQTDTVENHGIYKALKHFELI